MTDFKFSGETTRTDIPELVSLFDPNVPVEAITAIFTAPGEMTLGELREHVVAMAKVWDQAQFHLDRLLKARDSVIESVAVASSRLAEADETERVT